MFKPALCGEGTDNILLPSSQSAIYSPMDTATAAFKINRRKIVGHPALIPENFFYLLHLSQEGSQLHVEQS